MWLRSLAVPVLLPLASNNSHRARCGKVNAMRSTIFEVLEPMRLGKHNHVLIENVLSEPAPCSLAI
jgi:hypothetical protein